MWVHANTLLVLPKEATGNVLDPVWVHGNIILLLGGVVGGMLLSLQIGSNILRGTCQIYLLSPLRRRQFWQTTLNILLVLCGGVPDMSWVQHRMVMICHHYYLWNVEGQNLKFLKMHFIRYYKIWRKNPCASNMLTNSSSSSNWWPQLTSWLFCHFRGVQQAKKMYFSLIYGTLDTKVSKVLAVTVLQVNHSNP